jgi:hypothetical protein
MVLEPLFPLKADRVMVVAGSSYNERNRKLTPALHVESSTNSALRLWPLLTDWEPGCALDASLMEPVRMSLVFLAGRTRLALVGLKSSTATSDVWGGWDRRLRTSAIYEWLNDLDLNPWRA